MTIIRRFTTITLRPHPLQFVIDELILLVLCLLALGYGGTDGVFSELAVYAGLALLLYLIYKYIKLRRTVYTLSGEQLKKAEGVFTRDEDYIELYRVVDFAERKNLLQMLFDRTTPKLSLQGVKEPLDLVAIIRERVEYTKTHKPVYEITNRY